MAKVRSCRRTDQERAVHDRATRIRKMTDAQLCEYMDSLAAGAVQTGPSREEIITDFLDALTIRKEDGLRVSDATIRKIKDIARHRGYLPEMVITEDML